MAAGGHQDAVGVAAGGHPSLAGATPLAGRAVRVVEAQHIVGTRKLVDSTVEQEALERLIESGKPPVPRDEGFDDLHYLLATSFRYPPLRHGSRFGTRAERAIWYGARRLRTAFAESAYYRLVFLEGTAARLDRLAIELTSFVVPYRTGHGLDLTAPPHAARRGEISSPTSYAASQQLGAEMRLAGVEAFLFTSARDRRGGTNVGLFTPAAFAARRPTGLRTWHCSATRSLVEVVSKNVFRRETHCFPRSDFEVGGRLPLPGL